MHSNWVCSFAKGPNLLHLYSIAHDYKIIKWDVKKLQMIDQYQGFYSKGYHNSFVVCEIKEKIFGIDADRSQGNFIKIHNMKRNKVHYIQTLLAPIIAILKSSKKNLLYTITKDNIISIFNMNIEKLWKRFRNIHQLDILTVGQSMDQTFIFLGCQDDKLKILCKDFLIKTQDINNQNTSINALEISNDDKNIYLGGENLTINILKVLRALPSSSSGSTSFESLKTLSSNDLEKKNSQESIFSQSDRKSFIKVKYGARDKKRKTIGASSSLRKSIFSNNKLLIKGSFDDRYCLMPFHESHSLKDDNLQVEPLNKIKEAEFEENLGNRDQSNQTVFEFQDEGYIRMKIKVSLDQENENPKDKDSSGSS